MVSFIYLSDGSLLSIRTFKNNQNIFTPIASYRRHFFHTTNQIKNLCKRNRWNWQNNPDLDYTLSIQVLYTVPESVTVCARRKIQKIDRPSVNFLLLKIHPLLSITYSYDGICRLLTFWFKVLNTCIYSMVRMNMKWTLNERGTLVESGVLIRTRDDTSN